MIMKLARDGESTETHPFTISSSPTRDRLSISAKSVGDFTSTIRNTKADDIAYIEMPYGVLSFLKHDDRDLVFIAGGIGITPFMSMLRYIYDMKLDKNVTLIWGNKTEEDILFREEMDRMMAEMPSLKVVHVMSKQEDWSGEKGYIDSEMLKRHISNFQSGQFFLCGPPRMMFLVEKLLRELNVEKKRIHYERFALR
jgi:predicted ferric reductase